MKSFSVDTYACYLSHHPSSSFMVGQCLDGHIFQDPYTFTCPLQRCTNYGEEYCKVPESISYIAQYSAHSITGNDKKDYIHKTV